MKKINQQIEETFGEKSIGQFLTLAYRLSTYNNEASYPFKKVTKRR
jgi:hypothetical protein